MRKTQRESEPMDEEGWWREKGEAAGQRTLENRRVSAKGERGWEML